VLALDLDLVSRSVAPLLMGVDALLGCLRWLRGVTTVHSPSPIDTDSARERLVREV